MNGFTEFDPTVALPAGTTVLEASAGTGKTHAVAELAVQLIGDGETTIDRLLMVTFGRYATRELRARVRTHLLRATAYQQPGPRHDRLVAAVAAFDTARVMTIHEFCQAMYAQLGILASADPSGQVTADLAPLVREVATDLYLSRYAFDEREPPFRLDDVKRRSGPQHRRALPGHLRRRPCAATDCAVRRRRPRRPARRLRRERAPGRRRTALETGAADLRRPVGPVARHPGRPCHRGAQLRTPSEPLRRRAGGRVPGH